MTHALAVRVRDTTEEDLKTKVAKHDKRCGGCDPYIPNHVSQALCKRCKGTGREPLKFLAIFTELAESNKPDNSGGYNDDDE